VRIRLLYNVERDMSVIAKPVVPGSMPVHIINFSCNCLLLVYIEFTYTQSVMYGGPLVPLKCFLLLSLQNVIFRFCKFLLCFFTFYFVFAIFLFLQTTAFTVFFSIFKYWLLFYK